MVQSGCPPSAFLPKRAASSPRNTFGRRGTQIIASGGQYTHTPRTGEFGQPRDCALLDGGINPAPEKSLDQVCSTAVAEKIYSNCIRYYPFVLGAQPARMIDLATFYAAVANEGALPNPHAIDSIEIDGRVVYKAA